MTGGHVWFLCRFASDVKVSWVCVCSRLAQTSMQVMRGRSGPGVIALVGADPVNDVMCLPRAGAC